MSRQTLASKLTHVRGGLDNAVRQAEERHLEDLYILDADCHQRLPFSYFDQYLEEKWKKVLVTRNRPYDKEEDPRLVADMKKAFPDTIREPDQFNKHRIKRTETRFVTHTTSPEELVQIFAHRMHDIGIKQSVLLTAGLLGAGYDSNPEFEAALADAYNRYMDEYFMGKYPELLSCIYAPTTAPEMGAELIKRYGSKPGHCGVLLTSSGLNADSGNWEPIFEAAQRQRLPICFHGGGFGFAGKSGLNGFGFTQFVSNHAVGFPFPLISQLVGLVMSGIPERFPKLKFVFMEGGVTWVPWIKARLDHEYTMRRNEAPVLKKFPSEYIDDFYFTTQPLENPKNPKLLEDLLKLFPAEDRLLYASDYPHWDFDTPGRVYDLPFFDMEAKKKILGENSKEVFKLAW